MTALYRTYRPQTFEEVIGQDSAVRTLRNAIDGDRVAHAYLFTGTKGTGKTTLAKILAKSLNCINGPTTKPCCECDSCVSIADGHSMDVMELDAASNRGIDAIRSLIIDTVAFRPTQGTRRVYILDEAHQLTKDAFNALLKTIEEPPDHVLFVFCTTEAHQMMPTVRDRCQRIRLAPPGTETLLTVLAKVVEKEGIKTDEAALRAITRYSQGSFRNALGTLEMLATAYDRSFTHEDVLSHLGAVSEDQLFEIVDSVIGGKAGEVLQRLDQLAVHGTDMEQLARELAEHLRLVLLAGNGVDVSGSGIADTSRLKSQADSAEESVLLAAIDCISDATTRMRIGTDPRLALDAALLRACQGLGLPSLALRLAVLEHKIDGSYGAPRVRESISPEVAAKKVSQRPAASSGSVADPALSAVAGDATPATVPAPADEAASEALRAPMSNEDLSNVHGWWPLIAKASDIPAPIRTVLARLKVELSADREILLAHVDVPATVTDRVRSVVVEKVASITGHNLRFDVVEQKSTVSDIESSAYEQESGEQPSATETPVENGVLDLFVDTFDASVVVD